MLNCIPILSWALFVLFRFSSYTASILLTTIIWVVKVDGWDTTIPKKTLHEAWFIFSCCDSENHISLFLLPPSRLELSSGESKAGLQFLSNQLRHKEINTTLLSQLLGQSSSVQCSLRYWFLYFFLHSLSSWLSPSHPLTTSTSLFRAPKCPAGQTDAGPDQSGKVIWDASCTQVDTQTHRRYWHAYTLTHTFSLWCTLAPACLQSHRSASTLPNGFLSSIHLRLFFPPLSPCDSE